MKIAILAPTHKSFIAKFLTKYKIEELPEGYFASPFIGTLISELLDRGHEVISITTTVVVNNDYSIKKYTGDNFKWIVIPRRNHSFRFNGKKLGFILDFFSQERKMMQVAIQIEEPDFVHAHWSYEFALTAKTLLVPFLITIHDNPYKVLKYMTNLYRFFRLLMSEWVLHGMNYTSTVSPYMLNYAKKHSKEVRVIPNPISIDTDFDLIKSKILHKLNQINITPKIIMIANGWNKLKNGKQAIVAFIEIKRKISGATMDIFGYGCEPNGIAFQDSKNMDLDGIQFRGPITHDELLDELSSSHLMIHSSLEESFGVVLIEAMSKGVPVIGGKNSGAVPWVISDKDLLVDVANGHLIAQKALALLNDSELYQHKAVCAYNNAFARFSSKAVVDSYLEYYNYILASKL